MLFLIKIHKQSKIVSKIASLANSSFELPLKKKFKHFLFSQKPEQKMATDFNQLIRASTNRLKQALYTLNLRNSNQGYLNSIKNLMRTYYGAKTANAFFNLLESKPKLTRVICLENPKLEFFVLRTNKSQAFLELNRTQKANSKSYCSLCDKDSLLTEVSEKLIFPNF